MINKREAGCQMYAGLPNQSIDIELIIAVSGTSLEVLRPSPVQLEP